MIVATRFGSRFTPAAQREMEPDQYFTSTVKIDEMGELVEGMFEMGFLNAITASSALVIITERGGRIKPDKQPLPWLDGVAAV